MDQLNTDLAALQTAVAAVVADVATLPTTSTDPNDSIVAAFVTSLTSAGWTVTPPSTETELPAGETSDVA